MKMLNKKRRREFCSLIICMFAMYSSVQAQKRPPNYSQDDMPITSFTCQNRIVGGYYADPETDCQMFHVCVNVPGVGIQDFRFLCPNDTTFDQEHQICDDWYNIDCELSLYDAFDLYRIGVDNEIKKPTVPKKPAVIQKGTPIPLGPSSTVKPLHVAAPKKNVYSSVNNGISDEEDYYTKNGNVGSDESKVPNDILRGSHSSNFYDSKTRGREDYENDYVAPNVGVKKQALNQNTDGKKHRTLVRKLASKRPVSQNINQPNYNTPQTNQRVSYNHTGVTSTSASTPKSRGNVNYNTYTKSSQDFQDFQRLPVTNAPNLYQKINNLTEENNNQEKKQDANRNYENSYNFRESSKFRSSSKFTTVSPVTTTEVRLPSNEYLRNIANNYQQPATLINNQLQDSNEYREPVAYQGYNNQAYDYTYKQFKQPTTNNQFPTLKYQTETQKYYEAPTTLTPEKSTEFQSFYYQPNTTVFDYYKYYQTSPSSFQQKNNYYSTTTTTTLKYDPYANYQKSNEKYDEEEFLKTAPSSNLKPSDLNTIYNQKKNAYINATLKAAYNIEPHKASYYQAIATSSASPQNNYYQTSSTSAKKYQTTTTTQNYQPTVTNIPQNNYYQQAVTSSPQNNYYQAFTTNAPQNNYFSPVATNAPQNFYQSVATNAPQNNFYQAASINTQQTNYYQSVSTNSPRNNFYQPAATNTPKNTTYQSPVTAAQQNYFQTVTTKTPQKLNNYSPSVTPPTNTVPAKQAGFSTVLKTSPTDNPKQANQSQKSTHDYDYAYYDNAGGSSEYDGIDVVGEDFAKIKKVKQA